MNFKNALMSTGLSLLIALPAFAARQEVVTVVPRQTSVLRDSSEHMRIDKDYMLTAQLGGFAVSPISSVGLNAGYYFDRNNVAQLEIAGGSTKLYNFTVDSKLISGNYKHFFGNSFYTKAGLDYRSIGISDISYVYYGGGSAEGSADSITGNLALGNQWQWETFTMGCDWIGINPTIAVLSSNYKTANLTVSDKKSLDDSWESLAKVTSMQVLRFYVGASF